MRCAKGHNGKEKGKRCKKCKLISDRKYRSKPKGLITERYLGLLNRSRDKGWMLPDFTKEEFLEWSLVNDGFNKNYQNWLESGKKWDSPSVDRVNPELPYRLDNIEWTSWWLNWSKGNTEQMREVARLTGKTYEEVMNEKVDVEAINRGDFEEQEEFDFL